MVSKTELIEREIKFHEQEIEILEGLHTFTENIKTEIHDTIIIPQIGFLDSILENCEAQSANMKEKIKKLNNEKQKQSENILNSELVEYQITSLYDKKNELKHKKYDYASEENDLTYSAANVVDKVGRLCNFIDTYIEIVDDEMYKLGDIRHEVLRDEKKSG